jgi:hypothetical protein
MDEDTDRTLLMDPCLEGSTFVKRLQRLSGRAWIDNCWINQLERQVASLRRQLYALLVITLLLAIVASVSITLLLVHLPWPPWWTPLP